MVGDHLPAVVSGVAGAGGGIAERNRAHQRVGRAVLGQGEDRPVVALILGGLRGCAAFGVVGAGNERLLDERLRAGPPVPDPRGLRLGRGGLPVHRARVVVQRQLRHQAGRGRRHIQRVGVGERAGRPARAPGTRRAQRRRRVGARGAATVIADRRCGQHHLAAGPRRARAAGREGDLGRHGLGRRVIHRRQRPFGPARRALRGGQRARRQFCQAQPQAVVATRGLPEPGIADAQAHRPGRAARRGTGGEHHPAHARGHGSGVAAHPDINPRHRRGAGPGARGCAHSGVPAPRPRPWIPGDTTDRSAAACPASESGGAAPVSEMAACAGSGHEVAGGRYRDAAAFRIRGLRTCSTPTPRAARTCGSGGRLRPPGGPDAAWAGMPASPATNAAAASTTSHRARTNPVTRQPDMRTSRSQPGHSGHGHPEGNACNFRTYRHNFVTYQVSIFPPL